MKVSYTKIAGKQVWRLTFENVDAKLARDIRKWVSNTHELPEREAHRHSCVAMPCVHHPIAADQDSVVIDLRSPHEHHQNYVEAIRRFVEQYVHHEVVIENF